MPTIRWNLGTFKVATLVQSTILLLAFNLLHSAAWANEKNSLHTKYMTIKIDKGYITGFINNQTHENYLPKDAKAPILQIRLFSEESVSPPKNHPPTDMRWVNNDKILLEYKDVDARVLIGVETKDTYVVFSVIDVFPYNKIELVLWGPYPTTIHRTVAEMLGVVYNTKFAIGIQALNIKTLGGYPQGPNSQDKERVTGIKDENEYDNIYEKVIDEHRMWGNTAWREKNGTTVLQAFCRDRTKQRYMNIWGAKHVPRDVIKDDGGIKGSKIAIFGCPRDKILDTVGAVEVAEGLPHPMLHGKWNKINPDTVCTYLHIYYTVENIDDYLAWAKTCPTIKNIYFATPGPISDWGHFQHFRKWAFPNGASDYQKVVDKIKEAGFEVGTHTLSNFIYFNDPYVTDVDPRLKIIGHFVLDADIDADATEIPIKDPSKDLFSQRKDWGGHSWKNVLLMDTEFIGYDKIDKTPDGGYILVGCERGYFDTKRAPHKKGLESGQLYTEPGYKITHGNGSFNQEVAHNLARYFNKYGATMVALDGVEGATSEGHGEYSKLRFLKAWHDALKPELQDDMIVSASDAGHFMWHYISRFEWGDESLSLRSGDTRYRNMNQSFYERNFLPKFMGGYKIGPNTTLDDVEWFCAIAAGFDAGYAIQVDNPKAMLKNPANKGITQAMAEWEKARRAKAFPLELKKYLQHPFAEFHLEPLGAGKWNLYPRPDFHDKTKLGEPIVIPADGPLDRKTIARFAPSIEKLPKVTSTGRGWGRMPQNVVDGDRRLTSYWGALPLPQSLTVDLEKEKTLNGIKVYPYYDGDSVFQYIVEISTDGETWKVVGDMTANEKAATKNGDDFKFAQPEKSRFIRVKVLGTNKRTTKFIVEVEWY